jgi:hypothetical protein
MFTGRARGLRSTLERLHPARPGYSRSLTRQPWAAWQSASSRDASGSFCRNASSRYVASYTDVRPRPTASLMSWSVNGLNPRRLVTKERPSRSSATACRVCSGSAPSARRDQAAAATARQTLLPVTEPRNRGKLPFAPLIVSFACTARSRGGWRHPPGVCAASSRSLKVGLAKLPRKLSAR